MAIVKLFQNIYLSLGVGIYVAYSNIRRLKMDKEAQEKIAKLVFKRCFPEYDLLTLEPYLKIAEEILIILGRLGYRKLPEDKPPLLSDEEIENTYKEYEPVTDIMNLHMVFLKDIAQAQRKAGIKHYEGRGK